jgi:dTDP-4-dehydrorhamnose reductase
MNKFILYGHNGWIGQQLIELFNKGNYSYILGNSRADDINNVRNELVNNNVTHVISLIGRTHGFIGNKEYPTIDYLEQKGKLYENIRDNLYAPLTLAMICKELGIHFTYMGTGCIFEYDNEHPFGKEENGFTEDSLPNFFGSSYSIVKGFTDRLMHLYDNVLNIRIRMPITNDTSSRNFITKITTYKKVCSIPNSMSVLPELLPLMVDIVDKKVTGTINLCNPGLITHNEILEMYKQYVNPDFTWENFSLEEQSEILAAGRSNNFMETNRLQTLYPNVKNIKDSVKDVLKNYKS